MATQIELNGTTTPPWESRPARATIGLPAERAARSSRLVDALASAALEGRLKWEEVEIGALVLHRFDHLATAGFWAAYRSLNGAPALGGRRR